MEEIEQEQKEENEKSMTRSERKHEAILSGALEVFLEKGFLGASVDDVAARSGVSKQTVYKHFGDKEQLFTKVIISTINQFGEPFYDSAVELQKSKSIEDSLRSLALTLLDVVLQPNILRLRRLVISEVTRFPDLGKHYFDEGPRRGVKMLEELFDRFCEQGLLREGCSQQAAIQFNWLVVSIPINRAMIMGESAVPSKRELNQIVDEALRVFLAAYGN